MQTNQQFNQIRPMPQQYQQQYQPILQQQPMNQMVDNSQQSNQRKLPPLPRMTTQSSHPAIALYSSQRIQMRQDSSNNSFNSSGQLTPLEQNSSKLSLAGFSSNQSMQSLGSSDMIASQQSSINRTFPVIYNNYTFMVDPISLRDASERFKKLIEPFIKDNQLIAEAQLEVLGFDFSQRNMNNFLKLCQNLPTDVQNSEMKEICEIAKMFQAEKIYNIGLSFVQNSIDSNFFVPDDKYDGSDGKTYMLIECENTAIHHADLGDLEFDDFGDIDEKDENENNKNNNDADIQNTEKKQDEIEKKEEPKQEKVKSVIYYIRVENHAIKCPVFHFSLDKKMLYSAKQKGNNIFIGVGSDIHINSDTSNHVAHIYQDDDYNNFVRLKDDQFKIKYVNSGKPNHISLDVTFPYNQRKINWTPKTPKYNPSKNKFYLNFHGEYHHTPIRSRKNIVLQNCNGHTTFIVRKMDNNLYEIEALPLVDPLIVFSIGLSDIVGPYIDPLLGF